MLPSASHVTLRRTPTGVLRRFRVAAGVVGTAAVVVAVLTLVGVGLGPRLGYYRSLTVLSGSMRPAFAPGDVVIVTPEPIRDVRAGQVITYAIPVGDHHVETHRVVHVVRGGGVSGPLALGAWTSSASSSGSVSAASLAAPTGLAAAWGTCVRNVSFQVVLTWNAVSDARGYLVYRGTSATGPWTQIGPTAVS